jgi:hypothetical protein
VQVFVAAVVLCCLPYTQLPGSTLATQAQLHNTLIQLRGSALASQAQLHTMVAASGCTHPEQAVNALIWHFWPKVSRQVRKRVKRVVVPASTVSGRHATK